MKPGYTARELALLLGVAMQSIHRRAERESWPCSDAAGNGGRRRLFDATRLPLDLQKALLVRDRTPGQEAGHPESTAAAETAASGVARDGQRQSPSSDTWAHFERLPEKSKAEARRRLGLIETVERIVEAGTPRMQAARRTAQDSGEHPATLRRWRRQVKGLARPDWLPALAPGYAGRTATAECSPEAWDVFKADYLRLECPASAACYERLKRIAAERGWTVPSLRTLMRRLGREVPRGAFVLARRGREEMDRIYPAQERDKSALHALEAVNADGHKFDVFVRWADDTVGRPVMAAWQDVYSGKLLSWRVDRTESAELIRLAIGDMVERYGIPVSAYLDNGRGFASKWITGRMKWRHRFKVKPEEPQGVLTQLGVQVHWATPYHGQAKPIERAFRDLCETVAKHPSFSGAYTGNNPTAKPEDYGSRAIPIDDFLAVLTSELHAHNQRQGRRSKVCAGRSFDEAFNASYSHAEIRKATAEQRRLWLLAAEGLTAQQPSGHVQLLGNRFWSEALIPFAGRPVVARFDPQRLQEPVHVYTPDGRYVGLAECVHAAGFADLGAAREHAQAKAGLRKATRAQLAAERRLTAAEVGAMLPDAEEAETPGASVLRIAFGTPSPAQEQQDEEADGLFGRAVAAMAPGFFKG